MIRKAKQIKGSKQRLQRPKHRKFGELLIDAGLIDQKTLEMALVMQKSSAKKIGQVLMDMGVVDDVEIAKALASQLGLEFIRLAKVSVSPEVVALVPHDLAENYLLLPVRAIENDLTVAMSNPLEFYALDDLRFVTRKNIHIAVSPLSDIMEALERYYPKTGLEGQNWDAGSDNTGAVEMVRAAGDEEKDVAKLMKVSELAPVIRFANSIFTDAINLKASDIHIEPQKNAVFIRYRIDGIMREILKTNKHVHASLTSRIKVISGMDISVRRKPQDGRSQIRYNGKKYDLRISSIPTSYGEKLTIRILTPENINLSVGDIGLVPDDLKKIENAIRRPQGMIIVTGPTGSGKSTTLYSILNRLNRPEVNIVTVEDPIEFDIDGINQVQINPKVGITFGAGLRSILRQDPDIVMVGEIRDGETAQIACQAAQTGHLVLSTLHTNDAPSAVVRLNDLGVDAFILSDSLSAIVGQRLVRKICPHCKVPDPIADGLLAQIGLPGELKGMPFFKGAGCESCRYSGYAGRIGIFEVLDVSPRVKMKITPDVAAHVLKKTASAEGFRPIFWDGIDKARQGLTTIEEVLRVAFPESAESYQDNGSKGPQASGTVKSRPVESADETAVAASEPALSAIRPKKILVADDSEIVVKLLVNILESQNYNAISAGNGVDALKLAHKEKPDLILTDLLMPEMSGLELIGKLRSELSTRLIPVIVISAKDEVDSEVKLIEAGADDYLTKPVDAKRLLARVNRLLNRSGN